MPVGLIVVLVIALIALAIQYGIFQKVWRGIVGAQVCPGECLAACPEDYRHQLAGDGYCRDQFEGTKTGAVLCCEAMNPAKGEIIRRGDVRLIYNNDHTRLLSSGSSIDLVQDKSDWVSKKFGISWGDSVKGKRCYGQRVLPGEEIMHVPLDKLFDGSPSADPGFSLENTFIKYTPKNLPSTEMPECTSIFTLGKRIILASTDEYYKLVGGEIKYSIVVLDLDACSDDEYLSSCATSSFSIYVNVPGRNPTIALGMDKRSLSTRSVTQLDPGQTYTFAAKFNEPLETCKMEFLFEGVEQNKLTDYFSKQFTNEIETAESIVGSETCGALTTYQKGFQIHFPENSLRGVHFKIQFTTKRKDKEDPISIAIYPFQIKPEDRLIIRGLHPSLQREKMIDLICNDIPCAKFDIAFVDNQFKCGKEFPKWESISTTGITNGARFYLPGVNSQGTARSVPLMNGEYLCVRESSSKKPEEQVYSLALFDNVPVKIAIDDKPPRLTTIYHPTTHLLEMTCTDEGPGNDPLYRSGCREYPFSYAYVTNPLLFMGSILSGGRLAENWIGCPRLDLDTRWVTWRGQKNEIPHPYTDVRVICIRGTDNAGNHQLEADVLYSTEALLQTLILRGIGELVEG